MLKNLNCKGNVVIQLFYKTWKIQKHHYTEGIDLFYLTVTLVIILSITKYIYQKNLLRSSKDIYIMVKRPPYPRTIG